MICQTFSELVSDLARDQIMDAATRAQALTHARACSGCTAQLRIQQQLSSELSELAAATKDQTASPAVWETLSAAFDSRTVTRTGTNRRRKIYALGAIAAMLILTFAVIQLVVRRQPTNVEGLLAATFSAVKPAQTAGPDLANNISDGGNKKAPVNPRRHSTVRRALTPAVNQPKEIATDFISLTFGAPEVGADAQLVRMELPRSAMASFGLPVNMDRADQRVKADVLLGSDGLARAIRFVQ